MSSTPSALARPLAGPAAESSAVPARPARLVPGTEAFRRTTRATFIGGFCTFAMLYGAQPLMPVISGEFGVSPASASGIVSAATGAMALTLIPASMLADRMGRRPVMNWALALAAMCSLLCAMAPGFHQLLLWRGVLGVVLAGMPAVAMAYISEEVEPEALGRTMGLYIAGNALGGMSGRFMSAVIADWSSWRWAMGVVGVIGCLGAFEFWRSLPPSRHFRPSSVKPATVLADARAHLANPVLPWLFLLGFLLMGCFVSLYNYLGYRLMEAPFSLSTGQIGAIFLLYLVG
ncbi:MAG: MFS transporter, partial [Zoogloea sp.]|nr:MFS transporter [Zoogloea sp.]